ncbi:hypothetical protein [Roseibium litorale]|uniref:Uncharacterized protein n=1 Tax=Roseibium litorale TaxID=2803841 RepID=A0ABR9CT89_9HYPH|nr:hypothetical protein [Roseibium litorale]MBD8894019.1 hypothetical protein [Roseibium litorale]
MNGLNFFVNADGLPWAAFVLGHVDLGAAFTVSEVYRKAQDFGLEPEDLGDLPPVHLFHIRRSEAKRQCEIWHICGPEAPGAVAVTGIVFA